ncbi:MAG TPA: hypothetical protein VF017_19315 [Thermoanaerobaculia bacterium]|nr:hypothetical protein [Thermoanaerobaculia bacterium]
MTPPTRRRAAWCLLAGAALLRQDLWLRWDARLVAGLPVSLAYQAAFCVVVAGVLALAVRWAWPKDLGEGQ